MCKTSFKVTVFYDGTRTAKEVLNDAIAAKVRRKIDNDIEILEGVCKKKGWRVEDVYTDDGYSGTTSNRPDLQRLLKDIEDKRINVVVTKNYADIT